MTKERPHKNTGNNNSVPESIMLNGGFGEQGVSHFTLLNDTAPIAIPPEIKNTLFEQSMKFVLLWEGGFSNHPNDPGGATNFGVIQRVYDSWRSKNGLVTRTVKDITEHEVFQIYGQEYWERGKCPKLTPFGDLALIQFDTAVNMGVTRAAKILQESVGVTKDGIIGNQTLGAVKDQCEPSAMVVMTRYCDIRERVYRWIADNRPKSKVFLNGWMNRLDSLRAEIGIIDDPESFVLESVVNHPMGHLPDLEYGDLEGIE